MILVHPDQLEAKRWYNLLDKSTSITSKTFAELPYLYYVLYLPLQNWKHSYLSHNLTMDMLYSVNMKYRWLSYVYMLKARYPCNRPWRPISLWDVEAPTFSRQSAHRWRWGFQPYASAAFHPQEYSWYTYLCYRPSQIQGHSAAGGIRSIENSNDLTEYRNRDLLACSIIP
jgi:hypothetical protein